MMKRKKHIYLYVLAVVIGCTLLMILGTDTLEVFKSAPKPDQTRPTTSYTSISRISAPEATNKRPALRFTGNATVRNVDENGDGFAEAIIADVEVEIITAGMYSIRGSLKKNGQIIANRPAFDEQLLLFSQSSQRLSRRCFLT